MSSSFVLGLAVCVLKLLFWYRLHRLLSCLGTTDDYSVVVIGLNRLFFLPNANVCRSFN